MVYENIVVKRKCACCKSDIAVSTSSLDEVIYYDKKSYHSKCFIEMCDKRIKMKRPDISEKWKYVLNSLDKIRNESYNHFDIAIVKEAIFLFIKESYDISIIPTSVWQKLGNIYAGTYKGMGVGIPPEHLIDMWKQKIDMLNTLSNINVKKGRSMTAEQRINYDLSVLINKYDRYLRWIEKQKVLEAETKNINPQNGSNITRVIIENKVHEINKNNDDMVDLVDDIFDS